MNIINYIFLILVVSLSILNVTSLDSNSISKLFFGDNNDLEIADFSVKITTQLTTIIDLPITKEDNFKYNYIKFIIENNYILIIPVLILLLIVIAIYIYKINKTTTDDSILMFEQNILTNQYA